MTRLTFHYFAAFAVLTLYGGQVCPYVESLTLLEWSSHTLGVFFVTYLVNAAVYRRLTTGSAMFSPQPIFQYSFLIFIASGLFAGTFNFFVRGFPMASGMKLLVGWVLVAFFMSLDIALINRQKVIKYLAETKQHLELRRSYASVTRKFLFFSIVASLSILGVVYLVVVKDLDWIFFEHPQPREAIISILKEFAFIFAVIFAYSSLVVISFNKILKLYLYYQNNALTEVINGNFNATVPVSSLDEFGQIAQHTNEIIRSLKEHNEAIQLTQDVSILSLASLAETRDNETGAHIMRTQRYVLTLAQELKDKPGFRDVLTDKNIDLIYKSAPLHDVGKVGIPDSILLKRGKLTDDEFKIMKRHPYYGKKALSAAGKILGKNSFLKFAEEISFSHHEKWDGTGYPKRLKGTDIPVTGRLMALADVYDALISERVYKPAFPHEKARQIIVSSRGTHFDPEVVDAFLAREEEFVKIAAEFSDENYKRSVADQDKSA